MITLLKRLFIDHWFRKLIATLLALVTWYTVDQSLSSTKTIKGISMRVVNIHDDYVVPGILSSGTLSSKISLAITGRREVIHELNASDIEVVIDASGKTGQWIETIDRKNISLLSQDNSIIRGISRVQNTPIAMNLKQASQDLIPVYVTPPKGSAPRGYEYLDIWPYHFNVKLKGPEEEIKRLKQQGIRLRFDLHKITRDQLEKSVTKSTNDIVTFYVPQEWKTLEVPTICNEKITIDENNAKYMRIDFVRTRSIPLQFSIPLQLFISPSLKINANQINIASSPIVGLQKNQKVLKKTLYAKGVSELFMKNIRDLIALSINLTPPLDKENIDWSVHFINPKILEERYISMMLSDSEDASLEGISHKFRQEYLRNRFRSYMNRFKLYDENDNPIELNIKLENKDLHIHEICKN